MPSKKTELPRPTEAEMAVLRALWKKQPATVREVLEILNEERDPPLAYTTVLKFMQIMTDKGLVMRDDAGRTHSYRATAPAEQTKSQMVGDLLHRVFEGSVGQLVLQALGNHKLSKAEALEIRKLLDQANHERP